MYRWKERTAAANTQIGWFVDVNTQHGVTGCRQRSGRQTSPADTIALLSQKPKLMSTLINWIRKLLRAMTAAVARDRTELHHREDLSASVGAGVSRDCWALVEHTLQAREREYTGYATGLVDGCTCADFPPFPTIKSRNPAGKRCQSILTGDTRPVDPSAGHLCPFDTSKRPRNVADPSFVTSRARVTWPPSDQSQHFQLFFFSFFFSSFHSHLSLSLFYSSICTRKFFFGRIIWLKVLSFSLFETGRGIFYFFSSSSFPNQHLPVYRFTSSSSHFSLPLYSWIPFKKIFFKKGNIAPFKESSSFCSLILLFLFFDMSKMGKKKRRKNSVRNMLARFF